MRIILTLCLCLSLGGLFAQRLEHRLGYMLVRVDKESSLKTIISDASSRLASPVHLDKTVSPRLGIYLLRFDYTRLDERKLLEQLRNDNNVITAQYDHLTTPRDVPNDPDFSQQWQWFNGGQTGGLIDADTDADIAWDITHGGLTALGDTIVVAIVDDGIDYNHEDIAANVWINHHEIPGNNIDDDGNGYVDDINGWNAYNDNADVFGNNHGLNVAGMVGAVGNNGIGITGMNWNVKIMMIVGGDPESAAIASYSYALEQRILYEQTKGAKGAFVVATNSSWGIDFGQPADAPLWCAFYDSLGVHGILSAGATANNDVDIDAVGDLPTACPSEYLLSVTALNNSNQRTFSAYGKNMVDFGAPGEDIFTTRRNNNYGTTSGTSFASPIAAGLIALLYSAPCQSLARLSHTDPAKAARFVRDLIFSGVKPIPELTNQIRFGGSMNAGNSMLLLMANCTECPLPSNVTADILSDKKVNILWETADSSVIVNARFQPVGGTTWDTLFDVNEPLELNGLTGCTDYVIEFQAVCSDTTTGFENPFQFKTDGCCELPAMINAVAIESSIHITWSGVLAANYFLIQWRLQGDTSWNEVVTSLNEVIIDHLQRCSYYEYRLQTSCDTSETGFSPVMTIRTRNCGNCIDQPYCNASSANATNGYIDSLIIGPLVSNTGSNGGYAFYESPGPDYAAGLTYPVWSRPGFAAGKLYEQYRIWLDANQDGVFDDNELLLDKRFFNTDTFLIDSITIPASARGGSTRMRVSMAEFTPPFSVNQGPCDVVSSGEIEDYCVNILRNNDTCPNVDTLLFDGIDFTSAYSYWPSTEGAIAYTYRWREVGTVQYHELATTDTTALIDQLQKCKSYEVQVRSVCLQDTSSYGPIYILKSGCDVAVKEVSSILASFDVFPNPATDYVMIRFKALESGQHHVSLYNTFGQLMLTRTFNENANQEDVIRLDEMNSYSPGLYFIMIEKDGKTETRKLIKI